MAKKELGSEEKLPSIVLSHELINGHIEWVVCDDRHTEYSQYRVPGGEERQVRKAVQAIVHDLGRALGELASQKPDEAVRVRRAQSTKEYDAELAETLAKFGNRLRTVLLSEEDAEKLLDRAGKYEKLVVQGPFAEAIPWELVYAARPKRLLAQCTLICRPLAHQRGNEHVRELPAEVRGRPITWFIHEDARGWGAQGPWAKPKEFKYIPVVARSTGQLTKVCRELKPGATIAFVCHTRLSGRSTDAGDDADFNTEHGQELEISKRLRVPASDLPLLDVPDGALILLLACSTRCDGIALDLARRFNATVVCAHTILPIDDARRLAGMLVEAIDKKADAGVSRHSLVHVMDRVLQRDRTRRALLTVHGRTHIHVEL
jgi:hypothetical protein